MKEGGINLRNALISFLGPFSEALEQLGYSRIGPHWEDSIIHAGRELTESLPKSGDPPNQAVLNSIGIVAAYSMDEQASLADVGKHDITVMIVPRVENTSMYSIFIRRKAEANNALDVVTLDEVTEAIRCFTGWIEEEREG